MLNDRRAVVIAELLFVAFAYAWAGVPGLVLLVAGVAWTGFVIGWQAFRIGLKAQIDGARDAFRR